ncbi:MAG: SDR family NAD(P)-dependent oxidoreductase, partial [Candidatus Saccharimonadales bacterium]|nr:SDR family NAD(P)-dependent oxidoreductase [Candidatus Saccharimonadales bacterium]
GAIARALRAEDFKVIGTSTKGKTNDAVDEMVQLDLTDRNSIKEAASKIRDISKDSIDVLYNNAGIIGDRGAMITDIDGALELMQVNLLGLMEVTALLLPAVNKGGLIINMSSGAGDEASLDSFNLGAYNVSKAAVDFYTKSLSRMIESKGIKAIATDPEWVATDMGGSNAPKRPEAVGAEAVELVNKYDQLVNGEKYWRADLKSRREY